MAFRIPEDIIEKIRDETPINEVIGRFVPLKPAGRDFKGLCPFHNEKTPSFHAIPDKQIFYCFGCQKGGDVFGFLMEKEGMSFVEAVEWCASRMGLDLSRFAQDDGGAGEARASIFRATEWAQQWFAEQLKSPAGASAREYVHNRGMRPETVESFGLGFAPADGTLLEKAARAAGLSTEQLLQAALLMRKEDRPPFAYFRSRLIFPVRGIAAKIHGFGGRILGPGEPKYLNTSETSIFQKRKVLYGLPEARSAMVRHRSAVLVEGYTDALALHQAGWTNTVATCGTAFTPDQAKQLRRYAEKVVLLFDGDSAGLKAAFKAADVALAADLDLGIVRMPAGRDPADMVADGRVESLRSAIETAPDLIGFLADEVQRRGDRREIKERALRHLRESLTKVSSPLRAELMGQEAAKVFGVPEHLLVGEAVARRPKEQSPTETTPHVKNDAWTENETELLRLAFADRNARHRLSAEMGPGDFRDPRLREIFEAMHAVGESDEEKLAVKVGDLVPHESRSLLAQLVATRMAPGFKPVAELEALLSKRQELLKKEATEARRAELQEKYSSGGDWQSELETDSTPDERTPE